MSSLFNNSYFYRKTIHPVLRNFPLYDYWMLRRHSYLAHNGWFKSFRSGKSIDISGRALPWFVYSAISFMEERLPGDATVFEYGSGEGTAWWADKAGLVHSVEHNLKWKEKLEPELPGHVRILYRELGNGYESAVNQGGIRYDVIILDGRNRDNCILFAVKNLSERGVIIFDDSNWKKYQETIGFIRTKGFRQMPFRGLSPIEFRQCETSVFYRDGNLLGI